MSMVFRRLTYYLRSIPTLLRGIEPWPRVVALFLGLPLARPVEVRLRASGLNLWVRSAMDLWIVKETCIDREYERVGAGIGANWSVLDVGAALGDYALDVARRHPTCIVHAYEPSPDSFALLNENIRLNALTNVTTYGEAIGRAAGTLLLDVSGAAVQHRVIPSSQAGLAVPVVSLATALDRLPLSHCDLLKMDCEGAEFDILLSADQETLARIQRIVMEYHDDATPHTHADLQAALERAGFRVTLHPSKVQPHLGLIYANRIV